MEEGGWKAVKEIVLINGSPKPKDDSTSAALAREAEFVFRSEDARVTHVNVRKSLKNGADTDFAAMRRADAWVILFPLYIFCLPGMLMRFLQDYEQYSKAHPAEGRGAKVYAVVNCGFPEAFINEEAVKVIERFASKVGADFRFGVMIGGGPMIVNAKDAPFMKKTRAALDGAFLKMRGDILGGGPKPVENVSISLTFPRRLYYFMGGLGWRTDARKNGLTRHDLYRKPYLE
jgi:hypothetical protein